MNQEGTVKLYVPRLRFHLNQMCCYMRVKWYLLMLAYRTGHISISLDDTVSTGVTWVKVKCSAGPSGKTACRLISNIASFALPTFKWPLRDNEEERLLGTSLCSHWLYKRFPCVIRKLGCWGLNKRLNTYNSVYADRIGRACIGNFHTFIYVETFLRRTNPSEKRKV